MSAVTFCVCGNPRAKQSFRYTANGGGFTPKGVKAWQDHVAIRAREAMQGEPPLSGPVQMRVIFTLPTHHRVDCDNLNKAVSDALNGIVYEDDNQVVDLRIIKLYGNPAGVNISVRDYQEGQQPTLFRHDTPAATHTAGLFGE